MDGQTELNKIEWWKKTHPYPENKLPAAQASPVTHIKQLH